MIAPVHPGRERLGGRAIQKAAAELGGRRALAIALLRRPDAVKAELNRRGTFLASWLGLDEALRRTPEGASAQLPATLLLILDDSGSLRLFEGVQKLHLRLGEELMSWGPGRARVTVRDRLRR